MSGMVNVLIVDDSPTARRMLAGIINAAPGMRVVGEAINGRQGIKLANELRPDVILMDVIMPEMDGLEATREIMHATPMPIVVCSASLEAWETDIAFQAINAGALAVLQKPVGPQSPDHTAQVNELINTLRTMAGVRVIHHWRRPDGPPAAPGAVAPATESPEIKPITPPELVDHCRLDRRPCRHQRHPAGAACRFPAAHRGRPAYRAGFHHLAGLVAGQHHAAEGRHCAGRRRAATGHSPSGPCQCPPAPGARSPLST